jgi:putative SOS response-associated peptidase YedK
MCGRFTLTRRDFDALAAELGAEADPSLAASYRPRYNIAPTDWHWLVRQKLEVRHLLPARWGLVNSWAHDAKGAARQINARAESAPKSRAFGEAFLARRCVVPADGFFEWSGRKANRRPIWYHGPDGGLLLFAGLYESWMDPASHEWMRSFTILTTDANETVTPVHDRMPVILPAERIDDWLFVPAEDRERQAASAAELLRPSPADVIVATAVSARVNSVANDDEACLAPDEGEGQVPALL